MHIALLALFNEWGGAEVHTVQLARTLIDRGHVVTVVCLTNHTYKCYRERSWVEIPLICLPTPKDPWKMTLADWVSFLGRQQWDACILVKGTSRVGTWTLDLAARRCFGNYFTIEHLAYPDPEKVTGLHFGIVPGLGLWWYREKLRRVLRSVAPRKIICVSDGVRKLLVQGSYSPGRKVVTVHNGIDVQRFSPEDEYTAIWRRRWGIPDNALIFGAIGRLAAMKGYNTALSGFQAVLQLFPDTDLRLVLVGEGSEERALKELADKIVPSGRVIFVPFCDRPWEPLSALNVFLMPSLNEGLPLALLEAMACRCCPIAMAVGGVPEVVSSPELGWLVPAGDVKAFANAMMAAAAQTPQERMLMGKRARAHIVENFNATVQFSRLVDVIESAVSVHDLTSVEAENVARSR